MTNIDFSSRKAALQTKPSFCILLPHTIRLHQILKRFSRTTGTSFQTILNMPRYFLTLLSSFTRRKNRSKTFLQKLKFVLSSKNNKRVIYVKEVNNITIICLLTHLSFWVKSLVNGLRLTTGKKNKCGDCGSTDEETSATNRLNKESVGHKDDSNNMTDERAQLLT